ncbi:MAG: hypothetical protein KJ063_25395, partial [Anaerolineae bacterium]|nr:hypothetical protein [Anaerolineae bacterium]
TAPETFRDTILETLIDPDLLLGIFIGTGAAIRGPGSGGVTDINVVYSPGVQQRMAQDANHNFPVLLDAEIMSANPLLIRPDGRQEFVQRGDINRKQGVFHITLGSDGETIIHRIFLPQNRWDNFAQNYGLPTWSNLP